MSESTVHNEKEFVSGRSSHATGQPSSGISLAHDLNDNLLPSDTSEVTEIPGNNVLIVDWDGPDDPSNPKKYVLFVFGVHMTIKCHHSYGSDDC